MSAGRGTRSHVAIHHLVAEQNEEEHGDEAEGERADHQLGLDARTLAAALALDVELDELADQNPAERHHEEKNQAGNGPENQRLIGIGGAEVARVERAFPDHQDDGDRQQDGKSPVNQPLPHENALSSDYTWRD